MTDYHPLIARAVEGLSKSTGEARRTLYERARTALVAQLRAAEPALSESEITKERLALEEAIRKVEAEAARKSRTEPRSDLRSERRDRVAPAASETPRPGRAEPRRPEANWPKHDADETAGAEATVRRAGAPTARERLLSGRTSSLTRDGIKGFRDVVGEVHDLGAATARSAQTARDTRASPGPMPLDEEAHAAAQHEHFDAQNEEHDFDSFDDHEQHPRSAEPAPEWEDQGPMAPQSIRPRAPRVPAPEHYEEVRSARSYAGIVRLLVVLIILIGVGAVVSWQWSTIAGLYQFFTHVGARQPSQAVPEPSSAEPKIPGRVPQEGTAQAPGTGAPSSQAVPQVAQRVVLYEEDPNDPNGRRFVGSAIWRTETVSPGAGLAPELAVRADLEIPERRMTVTWSLRRNSDKTLPASHTIEIMFNLPADFPGGGISNVPGILMKQSEQARGTPLAGLAVKVTNGFFLVGLSAVDTDMQRNIALLKDRPWFDIPIVYTNGGRAILAMEKGPPGEHAFADAFAAWEKK